MVKEIQKVKLALRMDGQYCSFNECSIIPIYDYTNDKILKDFYAVNEQGEEIEDVFDIKNREQVINYIENYEYQGDGDDFNIVDGYLIDGEYYHRLYK